jgi:hypothetical protein
MKTKYKYGLIALAFLCVIFYNIIDSDSKRSTFDIMLIAILSGWGAGIYAAKSINAIEEEEEE